MEALGFCSPCVSHFSPPPWSLACGFAPLRLWLCRDALFCCCACKATMRRRHGDETGCTATVLATRSKGQGKARPHCPRWQHPSGCGHDQTVPWIIWVPPHRLRLCSRARPLTGRLLSFPPFLFLFHSHFLYRRDAPATQAHSHRQI